MIGEVIYIKVSDRK